MSFLIRTATLDDVDAMVQMQMEMAWETEKIKLDEETLRRGVTIPLQRSGVATIYLVVDLTNKKTAGMMMVTQEWSEWRAGTIMWIQSVYIVPEYRRQGLFRRLYDHLRSIVLDSDEYQGIRLYVENENYTAQATYEKLGMTVEHYNMMKWMKTAF